MTAVDIVLVALGALCLAGIFVVRGKPRTQVRPPVLNRVGDPIDPFSSAGWDPQEATR